MTLYFLSIILSFIILRFGVKIQLKYRNAKYERATIRGFYNRGSFYVKDDEMFKDMSFRFFTVVSIIALLVPFVNVIYSIIILCFALNSRTYRTNNNDGGASMLNKVFLLGGDKSGRKTDKK